MQNVGLSLNLTMPRGRGTHDLQGAVIVAVATMEVMQVLANKIVNMVSVWRLLVAAVRSMSVSAIMSLTIMFWRAGAWVGATH
jgi:hypothetical protein